MPDLNELTKFARKSYRDGYLQSKVRGMIAYQIQALREKTGLNQTEFAKKISKTQSVVSRLEDTDYGRVSVQTLLDVACALDVALVVKFASYPDFLFQTRDVSVAALKPLTIQESLSNGSSPKSTDRAAAHGHFLDSSLTSQGRSPQDNGANDNNYYRSAAAFSYLDRNRPILAGAL